MTFLRPFPRRLTRPLSWLVVLAWAVCMAVLVHRSYFVASAANLATDLARYGSAAQWRGVYYRGEKIGFTVGQTVPTDDGFELQEDGRLEMTLLGATSPAAIRTTARVDRIVRAQVLRLLARSGHRRRSRVSGTVEGADPEAVDYERRAHAHREVRTLSEPPALMLSLARHLASVGLREGARHEWTMFDPATMRNAPVRVEVGRRELVRVNDRPLPAFRVELSFSGLQTTSWVTDTGEVVREESPMGLLTVAETQDRAMAKAVPRNIQLDLLEAAAVVPADEAAHRGAA